MFITRCSTSIRYNRVVQFALHPSWLKFLSWVCVKKKNNLPHRNERVVPNARAATLFSQSQGHRHAVAVC